MSTSSLTDASALIQREGGFVDNPSDKGGATKYGITVATLSFFRGSPCSVTDVKNLTVDEAKAIYVKMYIEGPGFDKLPEGVLKSNLIDFGVMSGPSLAVMNLQDILNVESDGVLGPKTLETLLKCDLQKVNTSLVKKRVQMIGRLVVKNPSQLTFLNGWLSRILSFLQ